MYKRQVLEPTGAVLEPTGAVLEATGAVLETTGAALEPPGAVLEPRGVVLDHSHSSLHMFNLKGYAFCPRSILAPFGYQKLTFAPPFWYPG